MSETRQSSPAVPPQPSPSPAVKGAHSRGSGTSGRFLARAAILTAALTAAGALLGLIRDQALAHFYGAGPDTDAFLVAWTVPEFASTLLIEDAMALILVPAFSLALARRATEPSLDPVRVLMRKTLPRLFLALSAGAALLMAAAPWVVAVLAPGLTAPQLAVDCTRLTATCAFSFGIAGYCSAALRAHGNFVAPALIYTAYNVGIITTMLMFRDRWGVRAAAAGVAVGGVLMVLVQVPVLWRRLRNWERGPASAGEPGKGPAHSVADQTGGSGVSRTAPAEGSGPERQLPRPVPQNAVPEPTAPEGGRAKASRLAAAGPAVALGLLAPVIVFTLSRQAQILIERFLAAPLPAGAISHLNYAQKVAQLPMVLSLMLCTVTFPVVARAMATGETDRARRRVERDITLAGVVVLVGTATVIACAPQLIEVLFQRGAFDRADTAATASVMRVYALGLLGHMLVGALVRCYFSAARPLWFPAVAMLTGLAVNVAAGALLAPACGVLGIAAANAAGITFTAVLLLHGVGRDSVPVRTGYLAGVLVRLAAAAASSTGAGWICATLVPSSALGCAAAFVAVAAVFLVIARALRVPEIDSLIRPVTRKLTHAR